MADSYVKIRFKDGKIYYANYQNTSDCMGNKLHETRDECTGDNYSDFETECNHNEENIEIANHYGYGKTHTGKACRKCMRVTFDYEQFEEVVDSMWGYCSHTDKEIEEIDKIHSENYIKRELPSWY